MIKNKKVHSAFSLLEVIFVLVILGIVASIGSSILVQVYEAYITQNAVYKVNAKTELVANQIVNRLSFAIPGTTISKDTANPGFVENINWIRLNKIPNATQNFTTIEWIGSDNDSFAAQAQPAWSGLANYETSTIDTLVSPGSNFTLVKRIVNNLSNGEVNLTALTPAAILFRQRSNYYTDEAEYSPACMGLINENNTTCIFPVQESNNNNNELIFTQVNIPKIITERYKFAWSAYAIVPETGENSNGLNDLFLYSNYQPWNHENYKEDGTRTLLMKNVSVLKFTENGGIIQFKLCAQEKIGGAFPISTCKEKVVLK